MSGFITFIFVALIVAIVTAVSIRIGRKDVPFYLLTTIQVSANISDSGSIEDYYSSNVLIFSNKNAALTAYNDKLSVYKTQLAANRINYEAKWTEAFLENPDLIAGQQLEAKYYAANDKKVLTKIVTFAVALEAITPR